MMEDLRLQFPFFLISPKNLIRQQMSKFLSASEQDYIIKGIASKSGIRSDGRERMDQRQMYMEVGLYPQASGSCRVSLDGGTDILVGVRAAVGEPSSNSIIGSSDDKGIIYVSIEW